MATTQIDAPAGLPFTEMTREFDAPRDLVFRAYTEPELLVQWLGPRKYKMDLERWEPRDGGRWSYTHSDDQGNTYGFHGVFHGDQTPDGLLHTFEFDGAPGHVSLEKVVLEERDGRTIMRNYSTYQSVEARDAMIAGGMEEGIKDSFARLDELIARLRQAVA